MAQFENFDEKDRPKGSAVSGQPVPSLADRVAKLEAVVFPPAKVEPPPEAKAETLKTKV